jgi:nuclear transport factor 2 (NTF2) superfamily protein
LPPFTLVASIQKDRLAEVAWNGRDPAREASARSPGNRGRSRSTSLQGRAEIESFFTQKRQRELDDRPITVAQRLHHGPAGRRPDDPAGLTGLGL